MNPFLPFVASPRDRPWGAVAVGLSLVGCFFGALAVRAGIGLGAFGVAFHGALGTVAHDALLLAASTAQLAGGLGMVRGERRALALTRGASVVLALGFAGVHIVGLFLALAELGLLAHVARRLDGALSHP